MVILLNVFYRVIPFKQAQTVYTNYFFFCVITILQVGKGYEDGIGVKQNYKEALRYYTLAAEHGQHRNAQYNLGCKYAKGQGVNQSDALALKWWTVSAEGGHAQAQFNLGMYYANGSGVTQSFVQAREWWTKAAEQGDASAIKNLKRLDAIEGIKSTLSSNVTDNSTVLCSKCNKPAQTDCTLIKCQCKGAQYCNNTCYQAHWKEHKTEHHRLVKLLPSTGETKEAATEDKKKKTTYANKSKTKTKKQKPNDRCACGSKKKYKKCCGSKKR